MHVTHMIILAIGSLFLVSSVTISVIQKRKIKRCSERTIGTVIGFKAMTSGATTDDITTQMWHPIIEYYAEERLFRKTSAFGSAKKRYSEGENVELFFDPNNPEMYYICGEHIHRLLSIIFGTTGILMIASGVILLLFGWP